MMSFFCKKCNWFKIIDNNHQVWQEYREAKDSFTLTGKTQFECPEAVSLFFKVYLQNDFFPVTQEMRQIEKQTNNTFPWKMTIRQNEYLTQL